MILLWSFSMPHTSLDINLDRELLHLVSIIVYHEDGCFQLHNQSRDAKIVQGRSEDSLTPLT